MQFHKSKLLNSPTVILTGQTLRLVLLITLGLVCGCGRQMNTTVCLPATDSTIDRNVSSKLVVEQTVGQQDRADVQTDPVILGYYPHYEKFDQKNIPWDQLTHLCQAFLTTRPDGSIVSNQHVPNRSLIEAGRQHDVPVILSVGGWGDAKDFETATATSEIMEKWVADICRIVIDNGYSGLDVDWEFPRNASTRDRFTQLLKSVRQNFDQYESTSGNHLLITSAITARPSEGQWIDGPAIEPYLDFINVMTYDFSGSWSQVATHHTPLYPSEKDPQKSWRSTKQSMEYWEQVQGFPKHKLNVGIPLYGRQFPVSAPYESTVGLSKRGFKTPDYKTIVQLQGRGWELQQDDEIKTSWLIAPAGQQSVIAFDDPESAYHKGQWAKKNQYRGIFFWAIGHDFLDDQRHHLLESAVKGWQSKQGGNSE